MHTQSTIFNILMIALSLLSLLTVVSAQNLLNNGGCEQWDANFTQPQSWTLDANISVTLETINGSTGNTSCKAFIETTQQANTDFLQTVNVEGGEVYQLRARVLFTDVGVRVRGVVGDQAFNNRVFLNFLNPFSNDLTNKWLRYVSRPFTASDDIQQVGFRFYDKAQFTGEGTVYLDDIQLVWDLPSLLPQVGCSVTELVRNDYFEFGFMKEDLVMMKAWNLMPLTPSQPRVTKCHNFCRGNICEIVFDDVQLSDGGFSQCRIDIDDTNEVSLDSILQQFSTDTYVSKAWSPNSLDLFKEWVEDNEVQLFEVYVRCSFEIRKNYAFIDRATNVSITYARIEFEE